MKVSAVILTLNEETNLPRCLAALSWCDDVLVIDSLSRDRTVEIARSHGARVIERGFTDFADQRNYALEHGDVRHEWVLHLDADEVVTPELKEEIESLADGAQLDGFHLAGRLMMGEQWLRYSGMYPTYQVRLTRRGFRFRQVGHGQRESSSDYRLGILNESYLHFAFSKGLSDWFERHNRYSTAEAREALVRKPFAPTELLGRDRVARRRALKDLAYRLPFRPALRFVYVYTLRRGFLDGSAGYRYAQMLATYERMIDLKVAELGSK